MYLSSSSSSCEMKRDFESSSDDDYFDCKRPKSDVFMNYSYEDIGKQFISHLQGALGRRGFTISDHTMLPAGQDTRLQLLKAIEESEIYVVVFSTNYASSSRSLDELVDIMDCFGKFDQRKVLPIFYKVEPSDVRSQEGSFKETFQAHETKGDIDSERVQKWKQALKDAGRRSGLPLPNGDEGKFVSEIVKELERMQSPQELHVADHPVMIGSRVKELISKLSLDCEDVMVVAVFGISGIGKTTIVKEVYNEIFSNFHVSCFLEDIERRYNGRKDWKFELQKDLISQLNKDDKANLHLNRDGVLKIQLLLRCKKTLLVFDDVDHFERLEGLGLVNPQSFYKGSRIIVTTRDVDSLGGIPHTSYHTKLLNEWESRKLFIVLFFATDEPVDTKFVEEVVDRAGGLPLVLKVWSRHFTQYKEHLPAALKELKQIPHGDVQKQLQMSYDLLSAESKKLFLDIACFFNGMKKDVVFKVLNDEDFGVDYEIEKLAHKFLVENNRYVVSLSHVIKEMGHEVVRQENPEEPGQRTRLMGHMDVVRIFIEYSGTNSVRSIWLDYEDDMEEEATFQLEAFKKMTSLRFIKLTNHNLQWSSCSNDDMSACFSFKHLKYLEWRHFPCKSLDNIDMGNVVVIKLENSKLEKLWEGANKSLKGLKILEVTNTKSLIKIGNFIGLENLEKLNFYRCENLEELDSSIGCLQKLVTLTLNGCKRLKRLPWNMIGKLTSLKKLDLEECINISDKVGRLKSVRYLLSSKKKFNSHPNSLCQLHQLTEIILSGCTKVRSIPNLPPNMKYLYADRCRNLVNLPSNISELQNLEELWLNDCLKLGSEGFTQVTGLRNLEILSMPNCNVSQVSTGIGNLVSLLELHLSENTFVSLPNTFNNLSKLKHLSITACSQLQLLPHLPSQLTFIGATNCGSLDVMRFDSMQKAYIFRSKAFKELIKSRKGFLINLSGKELPEWCTYRNKSGNVLSFVAPNQFDSTICGLILCATREDEYDLCVWVCPVIYNKTKGTNHRLRTVGYDSASRMVMFYTLDNTTLMVEAGDTMELQFNDHDNDDHDYADSVKSCGLRLVYEDDVVDSGLVLKDVREPTLSLFP